MIQGLYGITDSGFGDPVALGLAWLDGGARVLQVRCKGWPEARVRSVLLQLREPCRRAGVPIIVNDHHALAEFCDGVHLGQTDGSFPQTRGLRGRSTHSLEQLEAALSEGVDYVGFGPVFSTATKSGVGTGQGLAALSEVVRASTVPVVAIGGIGPSNLAAVKETGAVAWAVISAVLGAPDPVAAARLLG